MMNRSAALVLAAVLAVSSCPAVFAQSAETAETETETGTPGSAGNIARYVEELESSMDMEQLDKYRDDDGVKAEDWLPAGSVVLLQGATKSLMVMSRFVYDKAAGEYFHYCGVTYPEGLGGSSLYFFNQDQVQVIAQKGYVDDYEKAYRETILDRLNIDLINEAMGAESKEADTKAATAETDTKTESEG